MTFFSQLRYYTNVRSASFDNFNRKLHSNKFSYMCVICVSKIVLFQFRNQYDNDVTVWSPQVSTFSRPGMLEVLWIQCRSLQSVFLKIFPAFKDILRDTSFDKIEDVIDSKGYPFYYFPFLFWWTLVNQKGFTWCCSRGEKMIKKITVTLLSNL